MEHTMPLRRNLWGIGLDDQYRGLESRDRACILLDRLCLVKLFWL